MKILVHESGTVMGVFNDNDYIYRAQQYIKTPDAMLYGVNVNNTALFAEVTDAPQGIRPAEYRYNEGTDSFEINPNYVDSDTRRAEREAE